MRTEEGQDEVLKVPKADTPRGGHKRTKGLPLAVVIGAACVIALVLLLSLSTDGREKALQSVIVGIMLGGVYALIALGVVVVMKATKVFNLSFGGMSVFLAYVMWWLTGPRSLPVPIALLSVAAISVLLGLILDRFVIRRVIVQGGLTSFLVTLIIGSSVFYGVSVLLFAGETRVMSGVFPGGGINIPGGVHVSYGWVISFAVATIMFLLFVAYFRFTNSGLSMRAVSENPVISQSLGLNVTLITAIAWAVGGLSAGTGGVLLGSMLYVNPELSGFALSRGMPAMLLGGIESIPGAFIGALVIGLAESLSRSYVDPYVDGFSQVLPYMVMVAILIVRPNGLFGLREIRRL